MIKESKIQFEYVKHPESLKPSPHRSLATKIFPFHRQTNTYFSSILKTWNWCCPLTGDSLHTDYFLILHADHVDHADHADHTDHTDHADPVDHCKMLIMLLLRCSHLPISMQPLLKVSSYGSPGEPHLQGLDIISTALQARSTEFSDFSRSPAYCPSCTEGKLEVGKKTNPANSKDTLSP